MTALIIILAGLVVAVLLVWAFTKDMGSKFVYRSRECFPAIYLRFDTLEEMRAYEERESLRMRG